MPTIPQMNTPDHHRPIREIDLNIVSPFPATPPVGAKADGADNRTPEVAKCEGYSTQVPSPDNTGPTTDKGSMGLGVM